VNHCFAQSAAWCASPRPDRRSDRRGTILIVVMIIAMAAILVVAGLLAVIGSEAASRAAGRRDSDARVMASSAISVVGDLLDARRAGILDGHALEAPDARIELSADGGRVWVLRLLPVGPGGEVMVSENGRLDLNAVDASALVATGFVDEEVAAAIIAERMRRGVFHSVEALYGVPGVTPEMMEGEEPSEDFAAQASGEEADLRSRILERLGEAQPRGLADVVTVHASEPALQRNGLRRIGLNRPWTPELGERLDERFGEGTGEVVRGLMQQGQQFSDDRSIVSVLRRFSVSETEWAPILDALTGREGDEITGRLDINTASSAALIGLGLTTEQAETIVSVRSSLSDDERWTVTWPLVRGILDGEEMEAMIDRLTVRSWCYRLRLAVLEVDAADDTRIYAGPVVFDVVYDLVDPLVRVAALREVTHLPLARVLAGVLFPDEGGDFAAPDEAEEMPPANGDDMFSADGTLAPLPSFGDAPAAGGFTPFDALPDASRASDPSDADDAEISASSAASRRLGRWRRP